MATLTLPSWVNDMTIYTTSCNAASFEMESISGTGMRIWLQLLRCQEKSEGIEILPGSHFMSWMGIDIFQCR